MDYENLVYMHTGEFLIRKNDVMSFANKWNELEIIWLSKVNQIQKSKGLMESYKL
jgi:hypothetical protein